MTQLDHTSPTSTHSKPSVADVVPGPQHLPTHTATAGPETGPAATVLGDPLALGLASFGVAASVVGVTNSGLVDPTVALVAPAAVLASGFLTLLIAGLVAFRRGETFVGVVFTSWSGFFLGIALLAVVFAPQIAAAGGPVGDASASISSRAVISTYHWIAAAATIKMNVVVFGLGTAALYVLGIAAFTGNLTLNNIGGWLLLATGVGQLYLSAATLINEMYRHRVLPVI